MTFLLGIGERHRLGDRSRRGASPSISWPSSARLALEAAPSGELADRQLAAGESDRLRGHDLVGQRVLDDAVLVDARLMGEGVATHDRLVGLDGEAGQVADQPAGGGELLGLDARAQIGELGRPGPQGHHDLFERGVAGALTEAVDRDLHLAGTGLDGRHRIGRGQAQVVVAMDAHRGGRADQVHHALHQGPELGRNRIADGVRDIDRGRTGLHDRLVDLEQEVGIGPRRVLGRELDLGIATQLLTSVADPAHGFGQGGGPVDPQLVLEVDIAGRDEHVEMGPFGDLDRLDGALRIAVPAAGERRHGDPAAGLLGDPPDGFEIAG